MKQADPCHLYIYMYIYMKKYLNDLQIIEKWLKKGDGRVKSPLSKRPDLLLAV